MPRILPLLLLAMGLMACKREQVADPCSRFFLPYPDHVSDRLVTERSQGLVEAMAAYNAQRHEEAATLLKAHLDRFPQDHSARMYLASSYLATGHPYDAELQLDFLERTRQVVFKDPVDWYNALCWLCSGQTDRALQQAERIATQRRHTYKAQAQELVKALGE